MDLGLVGRVAVAGIQLRGRCLIPRPVRTAGAVELRGGCLSAGLLRAAVRALRRPLYPLTWCSGSRPRRRQQDSFFCELRYAAAVMQLEDGPRAGGASGGGGGRATGSMLDRRAVAHSG